MAFFEGCPVGWGGGTHRSWPGGRGGDQGPRFQERVGGGGWSKFRNVCRIFVVSNMYKKKEEKWRFLKDALWGGEGVPTRAGLVDGGGKPRALVPGQGRVGGGAKARGGGPRLRFWGGRW